MLFHLPNFDIGSTIHIRFNLCDGTTNYQNSFFYNCAADIEIGQMEKHLGHLGLIAGIAPTLGFIGTISGVIKIFYSISVTENISIGNISGGLYEKMISSGAGLIVGIIAYSAYHLLNGKIDNFALKVQKQILEFVNIIQRA